MVNGITILSGTANPALARAVARYINVPLGACTVQRFPDGELSVEIDEAVRGREVYIIQPTSPPVNDHLFELLAFADACRRAAAAHITAIIPYFGYARSDKRDGGHRQQIGASMVATMMQAMTIDHVVTLDLHAPQIEGFFRIPVDSLSAIPVLSEAIRAELPEGSVVVAPDAGRVKMATIYAHHLKCPVAVLHKERESGTRTRVTHLVGDVADKVCVLIDDMISTGGTVRDSVEVLVEAGARPEIRVVATHGLLLEAAHEKLGHKAIRDVWITDSIARKNADWPGLHVVSIAPLIASAIQQFMTDGSLKGIL